MADLDFTPLYRSTIGFDHMPQMLQSAMRSSGAERDSSLCNIEKHGDDVYKIVLAVPGFGAEDIDIVAAQNQLIVRGAIDQEDECEYLHRGFTFAPFTRTFALADHVEVTGADLVNGLLVISLKREIPDQLKPRNIVIGTSKSTAGRDRKAARTAA